MKRQPRGGDRDDDARRNEKRLVGHVGAGMERDHAEIMHGDDAEAHEDRRCGEPVKVSGPALAAKTAAPTTSTQTRKESSVGKTR